MSKEDWPTVTALESDTHAMKRAIAELNMAKVFFIRVSKYQLKSGDLNYYPDKGTIYVDGRPKPETDKGTTAFIRRIDPFNHLAADKPLIPL